MKEIIKKQIILSIIIPVYNAEKYLHRCIDSILNQNYEHLELLLIDDGSKDNSGAICDDYARKDCRIKVLHKQNGGANTARNAGLDIATGKYITFVDADDEIAPYTFVKNIQILSENKNIDILQFPEIGVQGIKEKIWYNYPSHTMFIDGFVSMIDALLGENAVIPGGLWGKIYNRKVWDNLRLRTDVRFAEDMIMLPEIFKNANKVFISIDGAYRYIWNEDSACHSEFTPEKSMDVARSIFGLYQVCLKYNVNVLNYWNNSVKNCIDAWSFVGPNKEIKSYLKALKTNKDCMSSKVQVHRMVKLARILSPLSAAWIKWFFVRLFHLNKV